MIDSISPVSRIQESGDSISKYLHVRVDVSGKRLFPSTPSDKNSFMKVTGQTFIPATKAAWERLSIAASEGGYTLELKAGDLERLV